MMGHKICYFGEIWLIIPKLTLLEHLLILPNRKKIVKLLILLTWIKSEQPDPGLPSLLQNFCFSIKFLSTGHEILAECANSVDLDEVAHNEPPHLDLTIGRLVFKFSI